MLSLVKQRSTLAPLNTAGDRRKVITLWLAVSLLIVFDAAASVLVIDVLGLAFEGNGMLQTIADSYGFVGAMAIRVLWGISCCALLGALCLYFKNPRHRRFALRGFYILLYIHLALMAYHIYVMALAFGELQGQIPNNL